jgi:gliding motility-associated-like protein
LKQALYTFLFIFSFSFTKSQGLSFQLSRTPYECHKGSAGIQVFAGRAPITWTWSTGASNVYSISDLEVGNYYITIRDSVSKDSTIYFTIDKTECKVTPQNHFTPNGDNYNDTWQIYQIASHPRMKLYVFNKWGQQVHMQSGTYKPWDGKQGGVDVPDGTYYYIFYYEGNDDSNYIKGDVTILR